MQGPVPLTVGCTDRQLLCMPAPALELMWSKQMYNHRSLSSVRIGVKSCTWSTIPGPAEEAQHLSDSSTVLCLAWVGCGTCGEPKEVSKLFLPVLKARQKLL